jgi:hypothetical protein
MGGRSHGDPLEIETGLLRMQLDRATGDVTGAVKSGPFAGRDLSSLGHDDLIDLLGQAAADDPQSASLSRPISTAAFPTGARRRPARRWGGTGGGAGTGGGGSAQGSDGMDEDEALQILGLERGAAPEDIRKAHRRLMAKLHPDSGGSNFLAMQINRAKDLLLAKVGAKRR